MSAIELSEEQIARRHDEIGAEQGRGSALLQALAQLAPVEPIDPERIARKIASDFRVSVADLKGPDRHAYIARVRRVLYAALRATGMSYPEIGWFVGGRDHTTIMSGVRKFRLETQSRAT